MNNYNSVKNHLLNKKFTWLITGVAGFVGSHLLGELLKLGQIVVGIDNFFSGNQANIDDVLESVDENLKGNFIFYRGDIRNIDDCKRAMKSVDYVLHQAAIISVPFSIESPVLTNAVNVAGFLNVLQAAKEASVKRVIYASSCAVYGDAKTLPVKEETCIGDFLSPYAASKYINEIYAKVFVNCYKLQSIGLRYFNVFGPRQSALGGYAGVVPLWINSMIENETIFINGDGETTRDFCFVGDIVQANCLAALLEDNKAINQIYNIGTGNSISLKELFGLISQNFDVKIDPIYRDYRCGDIRHSCADISKAKEFLGYAPQDIREVLKMVLNWYIKKRNMKK